MMDDFIESDDEEEKQVPVQLNDNPCLNSFTKCRDEKMTPISDRVYKQILKQGYGFQVDLEEHKVMYEYELYLENANEPYDSNKLTRKFGVINEKENVCALFGKIYRLEFLTC